MTPADKTSRQRCAWAGSDALMCAYHDDEWGVPEFDSRALWEKLMLDGFQAGLSWATILRKRSAFRDAFDGFDPHTIAVYGASDVERLLGNPGIVRSRSKIQAVIGNARAYLTMAEAGEDFSKFVWGMAGGAPILAQHQPEADGSYPSTTQSALSEQLSKALKQRGFKYVGPVIVYAWMQATGIVNDHVPTCFRHHRMRAARA